MHFTLPEDTTGKFGDEDGRSGSEEGEDEDYDAGSEEERRRRRKKKRATMAQHPNRLTFAEIKANKLLYTFLRKYISQCESVEVNE